MTTPQRPDNWPAICIAFTEAVVSNEVARRDREDAQETYASGPFDPERQRVFQKAWHRQMEAERTVNLILRGIMSGVTMEVNG